MKNKIFCITTILLLLISSVGPSLVAADPLNETETVYNYTEDKSIYNDILKKNTSRSELEVNKNLSNEEGYKDSLKYAGDITRHEEELNTPSYDPQTQKLEKTGYNSVFMGTKNYNVTTGERNITWNKTLENQTIGFKEEIVYYSDGPTLEAVNIDHVLINGTKYYFKDCHAKLPCTEPKKNGVPAIIVLKNGTNITALLHSQHLIEDGKLGNVNNYAYGVVEKIPIKGNVTYNGTTHVVDKLLYSIDEYIVIPIYKVIDIIKPTPDPDPVDPPVPPVNNSTEDDPAGPEIDPVFPESNKNELIRSSNELDISEFVCT